MIILIDHIPANLETSFLKETQSTVEPVIRREGNALIFPALVRRETRTVDGLEETIYRYFDIPCSYTGQDLTDYGKCKMQSYADLRKAFYGPVTVQLEQQLKGTFTKHQYAVRQAFPKHADEVIEAVARFEAIKGEFWGLIDEVLASLGKTREDLPAQPFNAETMLAWATQQGMSAADQANYATKFIAVSVNLLHNGRNWDELFECA